jgi:drug/metabolite transporter (DMT)-like permease
LRGRGTARPVAVTAGNFLRSVPFALAVSALFWSDMHASPRGVLLALVSGGLTSGLGYVLWYAALRGLTATRAATVQVAVPVLTGFAGAVLLDETVTLRLVLAALLILGGVAIAVRGKQGILIGIPKQS